MKENNINNRKDFKRRDAKNRVLKTGESQRSDGRYMYRWTESGVRRCVYGNTLHELREEEEKVIKNRLDGIKNEDKKTLNDVYQKWFSGKHGLRDKTRWNYESSYSRYIRDDFGKKAIQKIKKSDVIGLYNNLIYERGLSIGSIDNLHTVMSQLFQFAVDDGLIRSNPGYHVIGQIKKERDYTPAKRPALTREEETAFLTHARTTPRYKQYYPILCFLAGTGCRIGEVIGLRHEDIDMENGSISINHTMSLVRKTGIPEHLTVTPPKTTSSARTIPMLKEVVDALIQEKQNQLERGIRCEVSVDGYTDFVFLNSSGATYSDHFINSIIKKIVSDYNQKETEAAKFENRQPTLIPAFTCHQLRHTFATRFNEIYHSPDLLKGLLGHSDIRTTMNIYVDVDCVALKGVVDNLEGRMCL